MKCKWETARLDSFADVKGGKRLPKGTRLTSTPNSHPYIRVRDLGKSKVLELENGYEYVDDETQQKISRYTVSKDDIIISTVGTVGQIGIVGDSLDNANLTENCVKLENLSGIDREYLYYYLVSGIGQHEVLKGTVGAVQSKLPIKNIQAINIMYPKDYEDQKRISSILSALDKKLQLNININNNLVA